MFTCEAIEPVYFSLAFVLGMAWMGAFAVLYYWFINRNIT